MFRLNYNHIDYSQFIEALAQELGVPVRNNELQFPPAVGKGSYQFIQLPNGLHTGIINCTFHQDWEIRRRKTQAEYYTLRFDKLVIPESLRVQVGEEETQERNTTKAIAYLTSSRSDWSYSGKAGGSFKGIQVLFSKDWLAHYLSLETVDDVLGTYIALQLKNINAEPLDSEYRRCMREIEATPTDNPLRLVIIQNRIMLMIERFFVHLYEKMGNASLTIPLSSRDINRVMKVENYLIKDVYRSAPSIQELARMAAISESKLKKDFKLVYGAPIYEYFQRARMKVARDRLLTGQWSVKEVAMDLGYANVSNFTIAFKKEFDILPSHVREVDLSQ